MNILTDEEKLHVFRHKSQYAFDSDAGQIEIFDLAAKAVIKHLAAGVSVEPALYRDATGNVWDGVDLRHDEGCTQLFTADQLNTAIAAARVQENERCVELADALEELVNIVDGYLEDRRMEDGYLDSFTTQPARAALERMKEPK